METKGLKKVKKEKKLTAHDIEPSMACGIFRLLLMCLIKCHQLLFFIFNNPIILLKNP